MIIDKLNNIDRYSQIFPDVYTFLLDNDIKTLNLGRHDISENCYALVNEYKTSTSNLEVLENHREYIDFQVLLSGHEIVRIADREQLIITQEYDAENDYELLTGSSEELLFSPYAFFVFYPGEAHKPGVAITNESDVIKKVVFKVKIKK